jgi:hypothetical protein
MFSSLKKSLKIERVKRLLVPETRRPGKLNAVGRRVINDGALMSPCPTPTPIRPDGPPPKHALEQPSEHRTIVGQDGIVPVLKKICRVDYDLFAENTAAINVPPITQETLA